METRTGSAEKLGKLKSMNIHIDGEALTVQRNEVLILTVQNVHENAGGIGMGGTAKRKTRWRRHS